MEFIATPISKQYVFDKFSACLLDDNILYMRYFENAEIGEREVLQGFELHAILKVDEHVKRIIHCEPFVSITRKARELVQTQGKPAKAEAYIIPALSQKILFNLYHKLRKRNHPLSAFDDLESALKWIKQF